MLDTNKLNQEQLLYKSLGVKDCVKWLEQQVKQAKKQVKIAEQLYSQFGCYGDCGDSYEKGLAEAQEALRVLIHTKISIEKYYKKLKHESEEVGGLADE